MLYQLSHKRENGLGGRIRTGGLLDPNRALPEAADLQSAGFAESPMLRKRCGQYSLVSFLPRLTIRSTGPPGLGGITVTYPSRP